MYRFAVSDKGEKAPPGRTRAPTRRSPGGLRRPVASDRIGSDRISAYHEYTRTKGVNWVIYFVARLILQPAFLIWFRLERLGKEHARVDGPLIVASNHRSFLDPFVLGAMLPWRRPMHYVAKVELFEPRLAGLDPEPSRRLPGAQGRGRWRDARDVPPDPRARRRALHLSRGDPDPSRLAGGAPSGRRQAGARVGRGGAAGRRPRLRARPRRLDDPPAQGADPGRQTAHLPADREPIAVARGDGHHVESGPTSSCSGSGSAGLPPMRKAAVIGAGSWGTAVAVLLARGGVEVQLGCRTAEQAAGVAARRENSYLPGITLADSITVKRSADIEVAGPRSRLPRSAVRRAPRRRRCALGQDRLPDRRAAAQQGPRAAARDAAGRVRRRADPLAGDRRPGWPGPRKGGRLRDGGARPRQPRRGSAGAARRRLRPGRPDLRANRRRRRRGDGGSGQERRLPGRRRRRAARAQCRRHRRRRDLARMCGLRDDARAPSSRPSRAWRASAI